MALQFDRPDMLTPTMMMMMLCRLGDTWIIKWVIEGKACHGMPCVVGLFS